jgi:hypothetical protein
MKLWPFRRRRSRSKPYDPALDSEVGVGWRRRAAAVGEALGGIADDLAVLDWDWHPDREPRPTKLLIRDQERENAAYGRWLDRKQGVVLRRGGPY